MKKCGHLNSGNSDLKLKAALRRDWGDNIAQGGFSQRAGHEQDRFSRQIRIQRTAPPFTLITWPVMYDASLLSRKRAMLAMS